MPYDLIIGKSSPKKADAINFGCIEYAESAIISRLHKKHPNWFMDRMTNVFSDQRFGADELHEAATIVDDLILNTRDSEARQILFKLSAAVSMALRKDCPLFGVAE